LLKDIIPVRSRQWSSRLVALISQFLQQNNLLDKPVIIMFGEEDNTHEFYR